METHMPFVFDAISAEMMRLTVRDRYLSDWSPILGFFNDSIKKQISHWEIDLRHVGQLNSMGLGALVIMHTKCTIHKGELTIMIKSNGGIHHLLSLSKLCSMLNLQICEDAEAPAAIASDEALAAPRDEALAVQAPQ